MNTASRRKKSKSSSNETYMKLSGWSKAAVLRNINLDKFQICSLSLTWMWL